MTLKQKGQLKKEYMPKDYRNFSTGMAVALIVLLVAFIAVCFVFAALSDSMEDPMMPIIAMLAVLALLLVLLIVFAVVISGKNKKLIQQRTNELLREHEDMPLEEAEAILKERKIITDDGFIADRGQYAGTLVIPYSAAVVCMYSANIYTKIVTVIAVKDGYGNVQAEHVIDRPLYNYVLKKGIVIDFKGYTNLIVSNKELFVKKYFGKDSDKMAMTFLFGALGAVLSDESKNINYSRKVVFDVLGREMNKCQ